VATCHWKDVGNAVRESGLSEPSAKIPQTYLVYY